MEDLEYNLINEQLLNLISQRDFIINNTNDFIIYKKVFLEETIAQYKEPYEVAEEGNITMRENLINVLNSINTNEELFIENELNEINNLIQKLEESLIVPEVIEDGN